MYTLEPQASHQSHHNINIIKYADDTVILGLISSGVCQDGELHNYMYMKNIQAACDYFRKYNLHVLLTLIKSEMM